MCLPPYVQVHHLPQDGGDQEQPEPSVAALHHPCPGALQRRLRQVGRRSYKGAGSSVSEIDLVSSSLFLAVVKSSCKAITQQQGAPRDVRTCSCVMVRIMPAVGHAVSLRPVLVLLRPTQRRRSNWTASFPSRCDSAAETLISPPSSLKYNNFSSAKEALNYSIIFLNPHNFLTFSSVNPFISFPKYLKCQDAVFFYLSHKATTVCFFLCWKGSVH